MIHHTRQITHASFALLLVAASVCSVFAQNLAILDSTVYTSPDAEPLHHASVLILHGKIASVGSNISIPAGTQTLPCAKCVVFAGFWNAHVHFTGPQWMDAAHLPAQQLTRQMQEMLTHSGFTTVVDAASYPPNTIALRHRIEDGEVSGPHIYTAGEGLYPPHGVPYYLNDLPQAVRDSLPQPETPAAATADVERNQALGTDIVKLFTGSYIAPGRIAHMPLPVAKAAVEAGHQNHQLAYAHPSDLEGVRIAMESGVDVLAHAPDTVAGVDDTLLRQLVAHHMAMIPTLKLFSQESDIGRIREIVARFHALDGQLIFGTDTGFLTDYSVQEEYRQLALAGLSFRDVLAILTTAPAQRFGVLAHEGRIERGANGDLTILAADPSQGKMEDFGNVRYAICAGRVIFSPAAQ
jgi:imidazolonepropionase-like amidohydrolase